MFIDDNFIGDPPGAAALPELRRLGLTWPAVSANVGREEALLDAMSAAGCRACSSGSSVNPGSLRECRKTQEPHWGVRRTLRPPTPAA